MIRRIVLAALLSGAMAGHSLAQTPSAASAPVVALYKSYGLGDNADAQGFGAKTAAVLLTKGLAAIYRRAVKSGNLDYDFFVQGQDFSLVKPIEITNVAERGDAATLDATLVQNYPDKDGKPSTKTDHFAFTTKKEAGAWRIDDATHDGKSVRKEWQEMIRGR